MRHRRASFGASVLWRHENCDPEDFLAFWLNSHGYGVLSLSYPLETEPEIMPLSFAAFRIGDWGRQAAETAKKIMETHDLLTRSVVLVSWSMGGRMVVPFNISAKELGLNVEQFISFAATPGFSSIRPLPPGIVCSPAGYFHVPPHIDVFCKQLDEMSELNGGRDIIPRNIYLREYIGGTPINLIGLNLKYDGKGAFVQDATSHETDTRVLDVSNFPLISAIYPTSILDASHALADKASWAFLNTYTLETMIGRQGLVNVQGTEKWQQLLELVHSAPERLSVSTVGNHFFFLGRDSAKGSAEKVVMLIKEMKTFYDELLEIVSKH